jgi:DNA uptake protein ComE-like DNA-binding protein
MRRVNLNTASQQELEDLPMVGPKRAKALIAARPLRNWEDVARVPGFELGMIDDLRSGGAELG